MVPCTTSRVMFIGADVNHKNERGETALIRASSRYGVPNLNVVEILLAAGGFNSNL